MGSLRNLCDQLSRVRSLPHFYLFKLGICAQVLIFGLIDLIGGKKWIYGMLSRLPK